MLMVDFNVCMLFFSLLILYKVYIPVTIVSDRSICDGSADTGQRADYPEDLTAEIAEGEARVERIVDEDRRLDHHQEVADRQVDNEHVGRRSQRFRSEVERKFYYYLLKYIRDY